MRSQASVGAERASRTAGRASQALAIVAANMSSGGSPVAAWVPWVLRSAAGVDYATLAHQLACCS